MRNSEQHGLLLPPQQRVHQRQVGTCTTESIVISVIAIISAHERIDHRGQRGVMQFHASQCSSGASEAKRASRKSRPGIEYRRVPLPPVITDTNLLLQVSAAMARGEQHRTFEAIRTRGFITQSVDEETTERSYSRARSRFKVDPDAMRHAWLHDVRPHLRIVAIDADELEHEAIDQVRARNADQADIDTAALAVLLSPSMVITGDDDLRAVARPHLPSDVQRAIRHAEPSHHQVARYRLPLIAQHTLTQGAIIGAHLTSDMARQAITHLRRSSAGRAVLIVSAGALALAATNPKVRSTAVSIARGLSDAAGQAALASIAAERDCALRMFPACEPQSLAHRIAQHIVHQPLWLAPNVIADRLGADHEAVLQACRHKWFAPGVFGSLKVGVRYDAPDMIEIQRSPPPLPNA